MTGDSRRSGAEPAGSAEPADSAEPAGSADVLVIPNCMRGFATAADVADALALGVRRARPAATVRVLPLADGGDGTLDALAAAGPARWLTATAADVLGAPRPAPWLALDADTAAVESAAICGLGARTPGRLRPLEATSAGVGHVLAAAAARGATTIWLGLGGTAVIDGGAGALAALGARFLDASDRPVTPLPGTLSQVAAIDLAPARRLLSGVTVRVLADVRTPLSGSLDTFGAQKGLTAASRPVAIAALRQLVELLAAAGVPQTRDRFRAEWLGAGGGIGVGLSAVARVIAGSGAELLLEAAAPAVDTAGLAITAEGVIDATTWAGKLPGAVVARRRGRGRPTALVAVRFAGTLPPTLVSKHSVAGWAIPPGTAITGARLRNGLAAAAAAGCAAWSLSAAGAGAAS